MTSSERTTPDLHSYLSVLYRRKWVILAFAVIVPVVAYLYASRAATVYEATSDVLITRTAQSVTELDDPGFWNPARAAETQVRLARVPAVATLALEAAGIDDRTAPGLLGNSSVVAAKDSDLMTFSVRDTDPEIAILLANEYPKQYIAYRNELETAELRKARLAVEGQMARLERDGQVSSAVYASLVEKQQQLLTAEAVVSSTVKLIRGADGAGQVAPLPMRAATLGLMLGLVLGLGLAFVVETLDPRVRSADEIAELLDLPLLGRLPLQRGRRGKRLPTMLSEPDGHEAEAYRMLRTNLEFVNVDPDGQAIMITSAVGEEGKSTTIANLAIAYARAGKRVVLVDLDLRRPTIDQQFGLPTMPGVTEVLLGRATVEETIRSVSVELGANGRLPPRRRSRRRDADPARLSAPAAGSLEILTAGAIPPNPGELVTSGALDALLERLRVQSDILLIDGPPMLLTGDTLTLSSKVDALIVAARANVFRRPMARELSRLLAASPAAKLGVVVTGTSSEVTQGYYSYYSSRQSERELVG